MDNKMTAEQIIEELALHVHDFAHGDTHFVLALGRTALAELADLRAEVEALREKLATAGADALDKAADEYAAEAGELLLEKSGWKPVTGTWLRSLADKLRKKAARLREGDPS